MKQKKAQNLRNDNDAVTRRSAPNALRANKQSNLEVAGSSELSPTRRSPTLRPHKLCICSSVSQEMLSCFNRLRGLAAPIRSCARARTPPRLNTTRATRPFSSSSTKRAGPRYVRFGSDPQRSGSVQQWDTRTRVLVGIIAAGGVYYVTQCVSAFRLTTFLPVDRSEADLLPLDIALRGSKRRGGGGSWT